MTITTIPPTFYQVAFNADPNQAALPPWWTDQSWRVQWPWSSGRGRQYELDAVETGEWRATLANPDGALDPTNTASPYSPNVVPFRQARVQCKPGPNALTPDQATAGEATGYPAGSAVPAQMNVSNDFGYTVTLAASGTAYQGSQVYQATLPGGATAFTTVLLVKPVPVVPGTTYSFSAQVRIPSGTSTPTSATVLWYDATGASISSAAGATLTPTSGSSSWLTVSVSGVAPSTAYSATLKIQIASGGSTAAPTTWQADGLQWEQSAAPTAFQVPFTLGANLLPRAVATGTASINTLTDSPGNYFACAAGSITQATGLTAAPTGSTTAVAWTSPANTTNSTPFFTGAVASGAPALDGPVADCVQVTAGAAYTASMHLMRTSSADATVQVTPGIKWFDATGAVISTASGTPVTVPVGSWARGTITATAPTRAVWGRTQYVITTPSITTASNTIYSTGWQFEQAAGASSWLDPGPAFEVITPLLERWPQTWSEQDGTYGQSDVIGDDAFAALSQYTLAAPFVEEVLALGPNFLYQLNDPAGSTSCADAAGKRGAAPVETSPFGIGSLTFGGTVTSTNPGSAFVGTSGPVATFANVATTNPPSQTQFAETFVSLHKTTTTPGPSQHGPWTRMIAFRASAAPGTGKGYTLWDAEPPSWTTNASLVTFSIDNLGHLNLQWSDTSGASAWSYSGSTNICDGNWHLLAIGNDPAIVGTVIWVDGTAVSSSPGPTGGPTGIVTDVLGCAVSAGRQWYDAGHNGDLAFAAEFPALLTNTQMTTLYQSWRTASSGESSGARIQRVLKWIGWNGATAIDTGQTTSMGPATDLTGTTALDAANNVTLTENGNWYASSTGALTFKSRAARYNQLTPAYIFGEKTALGEWPFEVIQFDYDPSHIANNVQVTRYGGSVYAALDAASAGKYFPRVYQRTINTTSAPECQDAADYLLGQYKNARLRVSTLRLHISAVPGLFEVCLNLELGTRIRVNRRPNGAPAIAFNGFVERIEWDWDPLGEVFVNLQCSPADLASYWVLAALRTTLHSQAASGTSTATINALPDAAYNALASSLPQGYQLTFDPGTAIAETMTLSAGGIPATTIGYTTATLTFTTNFAFTHAAGATVCEPLPSGYTDPTTWDAASTLGAASCAVISGGAAGTNTITVGPLGDGATNPLGSDWNTGDLLWISPGTPAFEGYNILTPNQSTAGEGALPLATGTNGSVVGVTSALGTASVTASASAWQGSQVWQVGIAANAALFRAIRVNLAPATAGLAHTWSVYVRSVTSGANPSLNAQIIYFDASGNTLATTNGSTATLTGGTSAAWTRISVTATAPAGAVWAALGVPLSGTTPASSWSFQADGLQWEQSATASVYCTAPQVLSVGASVAGYSSVQITLNTNLINSHSAGDTVCDPLPPGTTSAAAVPGTTRLAY